MARPATLTPEILHECEERKNNGERLDDLASEFNVSKGTLKVQLSKFRKRISESHEKADRLHKISFSQPEQKKPAPVIDNSLVKEIAELKELVNKLNERIHVLEGHLPIRKKGGTGKSPRADQIMGILDGNDLLTYQEIADQLNCSHSAVNNAALRLLKNGKVTKFESWEKIGSRLRKVVRLRKHA